jgi:hypothetical protein
VAEHECVAGDDRDHDPNGLVVGGVTGAAVLGDGCPGLDAETVSLGRGRHPDDNFVDIVGLLVPSFFEDVLAGVVLRFGKLGALDDA